MRVNSTMRRFGARLTSICVTALLLPQAVLIAGAQQSPVTQEPSAQQQTTSGSAPAASASASSSPQEATVDKGNLPEAPEPQSQSQQRQQSPPLPQQPVGTAAAPAEKPEGIPGSRPSGAAIAPAKQRRVRAFVISIGIALAGAAAIGTVVGLSKASHSTP